MAIEMLHDAPTVGILRTMKTSPASPARCSSSTTDRGAFTVPANEMERLFYSFSTLHCLAVSMQDGGGAPGR
jgi:hypothetical protein